MALVFDVWSSHLSQFVPAPYVSGVLAKIKTIVFNVGDVQDKVCWWSDLLV